MLLYSSRPLGLPNSVDLTNGAHFRLNRFALQPQRRRKSMFEHNFVVDGHFLLRFKLRGSKIMDGEIQTEL